MNIPKIIHQTWKDHKIPEHLENFAAGWRRHHPDWEYRLWTDDMNRQFISDNHPRFLPIYDRYATAIQRVDAVRYFILLKMGGVFVDLDFECLKNVSPLLYQAEFAAGQEPVAHALHHKKSTIISNAFMAAQPGSGFVQALCTYLERNDFTRFRREPGFNYVLDCGGPFMLTRVYEQYPYKEQVKIWGHELLYPLEKNLDTGQLDKTDHEKVRREGAAYAIHHYWGSWWQKA